MDPGGQIAAAIGARPVVQTAGDRLMIRTEFEYLLKRTMGLDAAAIGSSAIERAVQVRRSACKLTDAQAYLDYVQASQTELQELIEAVVVLETWFFRDREAFVALARMICEDWLPAHATGVLRLLSLPCSTGEEPYSMAMALLDAGFPASRFQIDAVDISERALALARRAEYGKSSFRGNDLGFRDRHFTAAQSGWRLSDAVRSQVRFQQGNLFSAGFLPGVEIHDVIFCRNVLIYFDRATQDRAVAVLLRLLTTKGVLFVGPSETGLLLSHEFVSAKVPLAFAFHKVAAVPARTAPRPAGRNEHPSYPHLHNPPQPRFPRLATGFKGRPRQIQAPADPKLKPEAGIDEAALLADQGRLVEAEKSCQEHMRRLGASAQALFLMGLLRDAGGNLAEAAQYYRKALYLDHHHQEALAHLALLLGKQGDGAGARLLRNRISRAARKSAT
jgi:chemotaxis protein methyltransferase WspC